MSELVHKLDWHVKQINEAYGDALGAVVETGRRVRVALYELSHGDKAALWERLGMAESTGRTYARLAAAFDDKGGRFSNQQHVALLPNDWGTCAKLLALTDQQWEKGIKGGVIHPKMSRDDVAKLKPKVLKLQSGSKKEVEIKIQEIKDSLTAAQLRTFNAKFDEAVRLMAHVLLVEQMDTAFGEQRKMLKEKEKKLERQFESLKQQRADITAYMTEKEFNLVRGCLHPDRAGDDEVFRKRLDQAFQIFNRLTKYIPKYTKAQLNEKGWG